MTIFRAPIHRGMSVLNRELFSKSFPACAAAVSDIRNLARVKKAVAVDMLSEDDRKYISPTSKKLPTVVVESGTDRKMIPLHPRIDAKHLETLSSPTRALLEEKVIELVPHTYIIDYLSWTTDEILQAIIPEEIQDEIPSGYAIVGHIAQLNLREKYLPYKTIIAQVIKDHQSACKTIVNKVDDVGSESAYRTFPFEVLVSDGPADTNVEIVAQDITYRFDFAKVYWNTRLDTEHRRLVNTFKPGEAICDVMAGVGPFALPAAKRRGVMVWANDLNPDCFRSLVVNARENKLQYRLKAFNMDGRQFIQDAPMALLREAGRVVEQQPWEMSNRNLQRLRGAKNIAEKSGVPASNIADSYVVPKTFDHFIMNLPASAVEFLDAYAGIYHKHEYLFEPHTTIKLPLIHLHLFAKLTDDLTSAGQDMCKTISHYLGYPITLDAITRRRDDIVDTQKKDHKAVLAAEGKSKDSPVPAKASTDEDVEFLEDKVRIIHVRKVSPSKAHYCASFRLPREVAFKAPSKNLTTEDEKELAERKARWVNIFDRKEANEDVK